MKPAHKLRRASLVLIATVVFLLSLSGCGTASVRYGRDSHQLVADAFIDAIEEKDVEAVASIASVDVVAEFAEWSRGKRPVHCPFFVEERGKNYPLNSLMLNTSPMDPHFYAGLHTLPCPDWEKSYCLRVELIEIGRTNEGLWIVTDFKGIDESFQQGTCY